MIKIFAILLIIVSYLSFYSGTASAGLDEAILFNSVNTQRVVRGLPALSNNDELTTLSVEWSKVLATNKALSHSDLVTGVTQNWRKLGENIGSGSSVSAITSALITSPTHLENMIDPDFTTMGIGITTSGSTLYIVEKFMQESDQIVAKPVPTTTTQPPPVVTVPPTTTTQAPLPPETTTTTTTIPVTTTLPPVIPSSTEVPKVASEVQGHGKLKMLIERILGVWYRLIHH